MNGDLNWVAIFIWNITDDVLRDLYGAKADRSGAVDLAFQRSDGG